MNTPRTLVAALAYGGVVAFIIGVAFAVPVLSLLGFAAIIVSIAIS